MRTLYTALPLALASSVLVGIWASGCGTVIGNPGKNEDPQTNSFVAEINYDIPDTVSGYSLRQGPGPGPGGGMGPGMGTAGGSIFQDSAKRIDGVLDRVNKMLQRLNTDRIASIGDFSGKGADGKVSGTIEAFGDTSAAGYDYRAIVCYDRTPFQYVEWSSTTGNVHVIRNHAIDPIESGRISDMMSEVTYVTGDTASIRVMLDALPPQGLPGADGPKIAEISYSTRTSGVYTLSGVHNWHDDVQLPNAEGDEYYLGQFLEDGTGEYLSFNRFQPNCPSSFDEAVPVWCTAGSLSPAASYSDTEKAAAVERLKSIALESKTNLARPELPGTLACPE